MVFNSDIFLFVFFPIVYAIFWIGQSKRSRYVLLTVSGYVFYGWWDWRFCFLLLLSSLVSFFVALLIEKAKTPHGRKWWMLSSVIFDLGLLGFFKYYNFAASNLDAAFGSPVLPLMDIVLPVGISFYTFHTISYILDVYAGRIRATWNLFEYLAYVSLFSQLVAGPIVRFRQIEEDLEHIDGPPREDYTARGIGFFVVGLIKKCIVADSIAAFVDPILADPGSMSTGTAWLAALGYAFQLYYDFSGYSDMAMGLGFLFGIRIPQNFDSPYQALGIRDFWRRWHISLSTWLRDYLYIALGGSRRGPTRTNFNLLVTMLLGGLWHGANWTFVIWGGYHGILLILDRQLEPVLKRLPVLVYRWITFLLVLVGWVFFRSTSFSMALGWLRAMAGFGEGEGRANPTLVALVGLAFLATNLLPETWRWNFGLRRRWAVVYALAFFVCYLFINGRTSVFLYYQF